MPPPAATASVPAPAGPPGPGGRLRAWASRDFPRWLGRTFLEPPLVPVAVEIDAANVVLAMATREPHQPRPRVAALRARPLPEGLVRPSALQPNVADPAALAGEVRRLFSGLEVPAGVCLVVPDATAKVAILELDTLPASRREALELVRFRLKKTVPFRIEDAVVDFQHQPARGGKTRLLTAVISKTVLEPYAAAVEALGAQAGVVTLSTLAMAEAAVPASPQVGDGDLLLANVTPQALTLSVFRGPEILLFRSKTLPSAQEATEEERRSAARREWQATVAYYQERLAGRGFSRALARLVGWRAADILDPEDAQRLEIVRAHEWAEGGSGAALQAEDDAVFAPALAQALRGVS